VTGIAERVREAEERIRPHVRRTPLVRSESLSAAVGRDAYLKLENLQVTGSFKIRGVLNKLLALEEAERLGGVVTASTGNHGLATAHAAELLGVRATIVLPETADPAKVERLRASGVGVEIRGAECAEAESWARSSAEASGALYVPPYNDPDVVAGQGTIAPEIVEELGRVGAVFASVGGGGMISGVAGFLAETGAGTRAFGCLPRNSPVMYDSVRAGRIVESTVLPTLSDSTAGGVEPGAITFELCRRLVDDWVLVDEAEIGRAMALAFEEHDLVIEGAAGVAVAGLLKMGPELGLAPGANVVVIVCGGNIDRGAFEEAVGRPPPAGAA
jgi:threonine dehydratase